MAAAHESPAVQELATAVHDVLPVRAVDTDDLLELVAIHDPDVELVALMRTLPADVAGFAGALLEQRIRLEETLDVPCDQAVAELDRRIGSPCRGLPGRAAWLDDVGALVEVFAELFGAPRVGLRVMTLSGPMCPRFHVDRIPVRLLTTYAGPGTEWLCDRDVTRERLGPGAAGKPDESSGLLRPGARIRRLPAGAVALFKGSAWDTGQLGGVVHRSPHAVGGRLLVSMDPLAA